MADAFLGKFAYAYVGGAALIHLKDWTFTQNAPLITVDPDIGTTRTLNIPNFISETGSLTFNMTNDDFATLFDAAQAQSAVALYLYPHKNDTTNKFYLYGNVYLTDLSFNSTLLGTVSGSVNFGNSDTTGIKRQNRA